MTELAATLEAIIFAAPQAVTMPTLVEASEATEQEVVAALHELSSRLAATGLRLSHHNSAYRLVTVPEAAPALARYHQTTLKADLSRPALETLAVIAYQGPITRSKIEEIRGVGSEQMIRNLLQRELIQESGRSDEPGRPVQYSVTEVFLDTVGITNLSELPPLPEVA